VGFASRPPLLASSARLPGCPGEISDVNNHNYKYRSAEAVVEPASLGVNTLFSEKLAFVRLIIIVLTAACRLGSSYEDREQQCNSMKIFLQDQRTQLYLMNTGNWTKVSEEALDFFNSDQAIEFALRHGLPDTHVVLKFPDHPYHICLPFGRRPLQPSPAA
jgi:hypothetical protein